MLGSDSQERDLERGLLEHLRQFLLELGVGFAFVGSQYRLQVGSDEFFLRPAFLPLEASCLRGRQLKDAGLPARVRRQNEFLSFGRK